ncbi:MAG: hypothetical protein NT091_02000, partial [Candidatus Falkowbacteria bacterium]|nr:hypothetical protein [Candidatus Falkowbacteria bacterium]
LKRNGYKDLPKSFLTKMYWYSMTNFILGSLYLLFTYEEITVLSARIFIILWLAYIIWRPMSHHKMIDIIKQKKADALKQIERKKYIPS